MFRLLKSVLSPMSAMRVDPLAETPAELEQKLHSITQYLINSAKQFDSWMELQNHNNLHHCLHEIYSKGEGTRVGEGPGMSEGMGVSEEELVSIIQFYTMLIINCKDELLICKLVSDDFVLKMCKLDQLHPALAADLEPYRINLIKAYMSRITPEVIKYMVVQDKFRVFEACVLLFTAKLGSGTLEFTTISNTLLNVMSKADSVGYLWGNVWVTQGLQLLYTEALEYIIQQLRGGKQEQEKKMPLMQEKEQVHEGNQESKQMVQKQQQSGEEVKVEQAQHQTQASSEQHTSRQEQNSEKKVEEQKEKQAVEPYPQLQPKPHTQQVSTPQLNLDSIQVLEQLILFLVELRNSVSTPAICEQIEQYCYMYLEEMLQLLWQYPHFHTRLYAFSTLFALFKAYNFEREAIENVVDNHLPEIIDYLDACSHGIEQGRDKSDLSPHETLTRSVFVLTKTITSKYSYLSERNLQLAEERVAQIVQSRYRILGILIKLINNAMEIFEAGTPGLFLHFIRYLLLAVFHLKLAIGDCPKAKQIIDLLGGHNGYEDIFERLNEAILELFLSYNAELKKVMGRTELWDSIIKWYEEATNKVTQNLLALPDSLEQVSEEPSYTVMLTYEHIRHYRYMIVEHTTLDPKLIKQEKFYHSIFSSPGLSFEPGKTVQASLHVVCHCLFHHNYQQIPVVVVEDKECLIIGMKLDNEQYRILINIKFKDIEGFVYGNTQLADGKSNIELPKFVKINLRGSQQIVLEFSNPKVVGTAFKDYLIKSRDITRQRQLSFLNQWLKDYQLDTEKTLDKVKCGLKKQDHIVL